MKIYGAVSLKLMHAELMANASSNYALHPTGNQVPRSYLPKRTRQVQVIPVAEALKLVSGTRVRCYRTIVRKSNPLEARAWNLRAFCSSHARTANSRTNATSHSVGANQSGKAHQESIQPLKPPGFCSEGSKACLPKSNPKISRHRRGVSVELDQKAGLGVGKKRGLEKFTFPSMADNLVGYSCPGQGKAAAGKRKLSHEDETILLVKRKRIAILEQQHHH